MRFVMAMFLKCATCTCSVVSEIWGCYGVRKERILRKEGECCLRADHGKGVFSIQVDLQITSRIRLVVLYYINFIAGRPYDFCR